MPTGKIYRLAINFYNTYLASPNRNTAYGKRIIITKNYFCLIGMLFAIGMKKEFYIDTFFLS